VVRERAIADETIPSAGGDISLFNIDPQAIADIHIGKDATPATIERIRRAVSTNPALSHVRVTQASLRNGRLSFS
jgi:hypothetical protein